MWDESRNFWDVLHVIIRAPESRKLEETGGGDTGTEIVGEEEEEEDRRSGKIEWILMHSQRVDMG